MSEKFVQLVIPRFDGHYDFWAMTMENFLRSKELWPLVKNYLFQAIDREILETILDKSTSQAIWQSMQQKYQRSTRVKRAQLQALSREFELLGMKEGEKVDTYLGRTLSIVNKMKSNGEVINTSMVVSKILRSLTPKFNYVVCSIEESNDLSILNLDKLHGSLLIYEQRMQDCQPNEQVLKIVHDDRSAAGRGRGRSGRGCGRHTLNKALIECFHYHKLGHYQYECPELEKKAHYASFEEAAEAEEGFLLVAYEETQTVQKEDWFLDSGCSNHMTGNKLWFTEIQKEGINRMVKLGNDLTLAVTIKGSV
ncbi:uncharacterized protein LOC113874830 [Abrus precatorius]|uniref:Uncharacterized protein LOC113874830 n=1 Tax=Abrus precatorius TaxID=3816 RepID=A0A8B8MJT2_ABRPR|nr:uncharacterized protein LOC113874830 [Abrus precatorius]